MRIVTKIIAESIPCASGKTLVLDHLIEKAEAAFDLYCLMPADEIEKAFHQTYEGMTEQRATQLHGRTIVSAIRYTKPTGGMRYRYEGRTKNYLRTRIEFSLRADGHVLLRIWQQFGGGWRGFSKFGWLHNAKVTSVNECSVLLGRAWEELGYSVKHVKSRWLASELAVAMLKEF